jgi:antitoxin (DNA-binding transcriptional repressor) of toxin-antitoxin stability system
MTQVTIHEAKTHLSRLINLVLAGEDVIIAKGRNPLVKIIPLPNVQIQRKTGTQKNLVIRMEDDFNEPLEDFNEYME